MTDLTPEQRAATPCYIGRSVVATDQHTAGTVVCAIVDDGNDPKWVAKAVAKWVGDGLVIERVPVWWVREFLETTEVYRPEAVARAAE